MQNLEGRPRPVLQFIKLVLLSNISRRKLSFGIFGALMTTVVGLSIPVLTRTMIDTFSGETLDKKIILLIGLVFILQAIVEGISLYLLAFVGHQTVASLRKRLWDQMISLPVSYFDNKSSGESVSRVVNDTGVIKDLITQHFPQFVSGLVTIIGSIVILLIMDWKMTLLMLVTIPLTLVIMIPLGLKMTSISKKLQDDTAIFTGQIQQTFSEIRLMKASNAEQIESDKGYEGIDKLFTQGLKEAKIFALISPLIYLVIMMAAVFLIGYGGIRITEGSLSTGTLVAFLLYLFQLIFPISSFAMFFASLQKAVGATERMVETFNSTVDKKDVGLVQDISSQNLRFEKVSFSYNNSSNVLTNITFQAMPGEVIAFVGPSGSGKSTIFNLIERFYEPTGGDIFIGSTSISKLSLSSWRNQVGLVSQDSPMLSGTIRENLCYGVEMKSVTDQKLWDVLKMAYADDFVREYPDQLDTQIGERGVMLSGGQRQRVAIARAFLRNPKILLMDEATASLDSRSETIVQKALSGLMLGRTTLTIAHRLSTVIDASQIIFIEDGTITGRGTHDELKRTHSLYQQYVHQQLEKEELVTSLETIKS